MQDTEHVYLELPEKKHVVNINKRGILKLNQG